MKTSDSHQASHVSNLHSDQPFFGAKAEQAFLGKGRSPAKPFFNPSNTPSAPIQAKLTVGAVGDSYEQEADRVAAEMVDRINNPAVQQGGDRPTIQRMGKEEEEGKIRRSPDSLQRKEEEEEELQRSPLAETIQRVGQEEEDLQMKGAIADTAKGGDVFSDAVLEKTSIDLIQRITSTDVISPPAVGGIRHPTLTPTGTNDSVAVKELQTKLLKVSQLKPYEKPNITGSFDSKTGSAVRKFQRSQSLSDTGTVDDNTWAALDALSSGINIGYVERSWEQYISGMTYATTSRFSWRIDDRQILVEVGITFVNPDKLDGGTFDAKKAEAIRGISLRWNNFKAVKDGGGEERVIQFKVIEGNGVAVKIRNGSGRSDADNWFILDPVYRDLAAHEFGHLIGLADEYQMEEADYQAKHPGGSLPQASSAITGADVIAVEVADHLFGSQKTQGVGDLEAYLTGAGVQMGQNNGMKVRAEYESLYPGRNLVNDLAAYHKSSWNIVSMFTYTDENSLMGTEIRSGGKPKMVDPQPRHLNEFVMYVQQCLGGNWTAQKK